MIESVTVLKMRACETAANQGKAQIVFYSVNHTSSSSIIIIVVFDTGPVLVHWRRYSARWIMWDLLIVLILCVACMRSSLKEHPQRKKRFLLD